MSLSVEDRKTVVKLQMDKAHLFLTQAEQMCVQQFWDIAANRYYYACFHAIQALFIQNSISCHTHDGLITLFEDKLYCPHCGSSQLVANKKGFGAGKACNWCITYRWHWFACRVYWKWRCESYLFKVWSAVEPWTVKNHTSFTKRN